MLQNILNLKLTFKISFPLTGEKNYFRSTTSICFFAYKIHCIKLSTSMKVQKVKMWLKSYGLIRNKNFISSLELITDKEYDFLIQHYKMIQFNPLFSQSFIPVYLCQFSYKSLLTCIQYLLTCIVTCKSCTFFSFCLESTSTRLHAHSHTCTNSLNYKPYKLQITQQLIISTANSTPNGALLFMPTDFFTQSVEHCIERTP